MSGDSGSPKYVENADRLQEAYRRLQELEHESRRLSSAQELEALEREIRVLTDELASLVLEKHLQASLDESEQKDQELELIKGLPGRLKNEGLETVRIRTASGLTISVRVSYYRRRCDKRNGKRHKGVYPGLVLLGIHERCTPWLASQVSVWSALLSSFAEVQQVLLEQGLKLGVKVIRQLSYRYAERARTVQQMGDF